LSTDVSILDCKLLPDKYPNPIACVIVSNGGRLIELKNECFKKSLIGLLQF